MISQIVRSSLHIITIKQTNELKSALLRYSFVTLRALFVCSCALFVLCSCGLNRPPGPKSVCARSPL